MSVTVNSRAAAVVVPSERSRRSWIRCGDLVSRLRLVQADSGLRADLARLGAETTDDLGPIR